MLLLAGAAAEGLCDGVFRPPPEVTAADTFQREWTDLLASIALFGPARAVLPTHLAASVDTSRLLDLELAEIVTLDRTAGLRHRIARTYEHAFAACRALEANRATTPLRSLYERPPTSSERLRARMLIGDAEYYTQRLNDIVSPFTTALRDIFGYYVDNNYLLMWEALRGYIEETFSPDTAPQRVVERRTQDLFLSMGLYIRERELLEDEGFSIPGISYQPDFLADFLEWDRNITSAPDGFSSFTQLGLLFQQFDWVDFLSVHTYWRSFFELTNMLEVAELTGNPLFLSGNAALRASPARRTARLNSTSDQVRVYQLLLAELKQMPTPTTMRETAALRRDPNLRSLRTVLNEWTTVARGAGDDDAPVLDAIRADIDRAAKRLKRAERLGGVGRVVGLASLPVALVDLLTGGALGAGLTPIGPAIDRYAARQLKKAGWVRLGRP